jgi:hypothetical protein
MNNQPFDDKKKVIILITITTIIRLLFSGIVELNNDEVYYWTYAKHLQWNYFDHPPMVALCIRFFTAGLQLNHELFIRLASVTGSAVSTWLIFITARKIKDAYTGWVAACLFTASFYSSVIAGVLILPDSPQLVFWLLSVYVIIDIIQAEKTSVINSRLLLLGFTAGCCILSKIHGVFCWAGFAGYIIFYKRTLLKNPFLYLGFLITSVMLVPSLLWSLNNNMSTYEYHGSRVMIRHIQADSFLRELLGSFIYNNPVNVVMLISALIYFTRKWKTGIEPSIKILLWLGLPLILTVLFLSVFNDTLPHWSGPAYTTLILVSSLYLSRQPHFFAKKMINYAVGITGIFLIVAIGIINYWPDTLGNKTMPDYGKNDVTLDMNGWREFGNNFSHFYKENNTDKPGTIFSNYWFPAAHLDFYVARPIGLQVRAIGSLQEIHHFAWLNKRIPSLQKGSSAYYIAISNFNDPVPPELVKQFQEISAPVAIPQKRSGKIARYFYVYTLKGKR